MQLEKLEYFLEVVRTGSINQSSKNLNISHQALNQAMHQLEKELGVQLFETNSKGSLLTANGRMLKDAADEMLQIWGKLRRDLVAMNGCTEYVRIGCIPYYEKIYYKVYNYMERNYPSVKLDLQIVYYEDALRLLSNHELDLAIIAILEDKIDDLLEDHPSVSYIPLKRLKNDIVTHISSPLANKEKLHWQDLQNEPLVFNALGDIGKNHLIQAAKENGCHNILLVHSDDMLYEMVIKNWGCLLINDEVMLRDIEAVKRIDLDENLVSSYGILIQNDRKDAPLFKNIIKIVKEECCK